MDHPIQYGSNQITGQSGVGLIGDSQIDGLIGVGQNDGEASSMEFILPPVPSPADTRLDVPDVEIPDASGARKRPADDLSDDSGGASVSSKVPVGGRNARKSKASRVPPAKYHMPGSTGVACTKAFLGPSSSKS